MTNSMELKKRCPSVVIIQETKALQYTGTEVLKILIIIIQKNILPSGSDGSHFKKYIQSSSKYCFLRPRLKISTIPLGGL